MTRGNCKFPLALGNITSYSVVGIYDNFLTKFSLNWTYLLSLTKLFTTPLFSKTLIFLYLFFIGVNLCFDITFKSLDYN